MDRQTLLVNTARSLKFLEEYANRQAQIWKVLRKYHNLLDEVEDLHSHLTLSNPLSKPTSSISKRQCPGTCRTFRHLSVYNRPIPPPYVLTLTTYIINCLSYRSISNITACIHTKLIQCRSTLRSMTRT